MQTLRRKFGILLALMTFLFILRVVGQLLVAFPGVDFLPAMEQWYSGLLPYPILLPVQILMIIVMVKMIADVIRGRGFFATANRKAGEFLKWVSYVYFLSMVLRYIVTMAWHPEWRWFSHTIPIWFHMVLAVFIYTYSRYQSSFAAERTEGRPNS